MAYANKADARAYAKAHYEANKHRYNPKRTTDRERLAVARQIAPDFAKQVLDLSEQRFIYPDELPCMFAEGSGGVNGDALESVVYAGEWLPQEAKTHGLFMRRPPFAYHHNSRLRHQYLRNLALIPQKKRGVSAELLILTLVLKDF
jgi:hypothetical protein